MQVVTPRNAYEITSTLVVSFGPSSNDLKSLRRLTLHLLRPSDLKQKSSVLAVDVIPCTLIITNNYGIILARCNLKTED